MNKKRIFCASVNEPGKKTEEIFLKRNITIGKELDCDIFASISGLPSRHKLVEKSSSGYQLNLVRGIEGKITIGKNILPLQGIIESGLLKKRRGNIYIFQLPDNVPSTIQLGELTLTFGYKEIIIPPKKTARIDRSLKKPLIPRDDYAFLFILVLAAVMHYTMILYLNTIEIKREPLDVINRVAPRFAKLILKPREEDSLKKTAAVQPSEEKKEKVEEKIEKEETKPKEETTEKTREKADKEMPPVAEKPPHLALRDEIRERVKSKGLLGVITAKTIPDGFRENISRRLDDVMANVKKIDPGALTEDLSSSIKISELERMEDIEREITAKSRYGAKTIETRDIIREKKELLSLEQTSKNKKSTVAAENKKRNEAEVYKTVNAYSGGLRYLYNNALRKDPTLKGKITVRITITPAGKVANAEIVNSTINDSELVEAIVKRIYRWQFEEQIDIDDMIIEYTFDFTQVG